jgi:hypothetical protein
VLIVESFSLKYEKQSTSDTTHFNEEYTGMSPTVKRTTTKLVSSKIQKVYIRIFMYLTFPTFPCHILLGHAVVSQIQKLDQQRALSLLFSGTLSST